MRIGGIALSAEDVAWLEREGQQAGVTRSALARKLCDHKKLVDGLGRPRVTTVRLDLSRLARAGRLALPSPAWSPQSPRKPVVREQAMGHSLSSGRSR